MEPVRGSCSPDGFRVFLRLGLVQKNFQAAFCSRGRICFEIMTFQELSEMPALAAYVLCLAFVCGLCAGSFLNCMAWRIVHGESVLHGRSHCAVCGHTLGARDLVPVFSYLFLHGRCRYCGEKISPRYPAAELVSGGLWVLVVLKFGLGAHTIRYLALVCILLALSLVDIESYTIPDRFIAAGILAWLVTMPWIELRDGIGGVLMHVLGGILISGGVLVLSLLFEKVRGQESMGGGDIKLLFVVGLCLGPAGGLLALIFSCAAGLVCAAVTKNHRIPFGPSISAGMLLCALIGEPLIKWYLALL